MLADVKVLTRYLGTSEEVGGQSLSLRVNQKGRTSHIEHFKVRNSLLNTSHLQTSPP